MQKITLSFDNGPTPEITDYVLDVLERRNIQSTFFVIGEKLSDAQAQRNVTRAHAAGHWIGNHSFTHKTPLGKMDDPLESVKEIEETQRVIDRFAHPRRFFRPFGGGGALGDHLLSRAAFEYLCVEKFTGVTWNMIPRDWEGDEGWIQRAFDIGESLDWGLVVLHDLPSGAMQYLDAFLHRLDDEGVEIVQDFPPDCVFIRQGEPTPVAAGYVADSS